MSLSEWEELRKQARRLENEIDLKLVSFSKLGTAAHNTLGPERFPGEAAPLIPAESVFESMSLDIENLLAKLSQINERMQEAKYFEADGFTQHTLQRHKEILHDYSNEFAQTRANHIARREREELLRSVRKDIKANRNSTSLNRRIDMYLKEHDHIKSSSQLIDDQINIAVETRENLVSQRMNMKKLQTRIHDISSRFPLVNTLVQRINLRKRRDSFIIGGLVGLCTFTLLYYAFY